MSIALACTLFLFTPACDAQAGADTPAAVIAPADAPLAAYQGELLDIAFEAATLIPVKPHIKDRSRAQEAVVGACLQLDQPQRARGCVERIDDWRRGAGYASLAFYLARHGQAAQARHDLDLAGPIADKAEDWRRDSIRVQMALALAWLGHTEQAEALEQGVVDAEAGKVAGAKAAQSSTDAFDQQVTALDALIAPGTFDVARNALDSYTELYRRFYDDPQRRALVAEKIRSSSGTMPLFIRIDLLLKLARVAMDRGDQGEALVLVNEAQLLFDGAEWHLEDRTPLAGRIAGLRFRAGDPARAHSDADAALALFDAAASDEILDIYRARAVRPLAEAYQSMGDTASALSVYRRALAAGVENPNSRPRAEDLSATCCSMAVHGVEPDTETWTWIRQIRNRLGPPW